METLSTVAILGLVGLFVLFVARWRPGPGKVAAPPVAIDEVPIATDEGAPLRREEGEREAAMREAVRVSGRVPRREWEVAAPNLVFVHDDLTDAELARILTRLGGVAVTEASLADHGGEVSARERFRTLTAAHGLDGRVESLGTHLAPGPFDAYRAGGPGR